MSKNQIETTPPSFTSVPPPGSKAKEVAREDELAQTGRLTAQLAEVRTVQQKLVGAIGLLGLAVPLLFSGLVLAIITTLAPANARLLPLGTSLLLWGLGLWLIVLAYRRYGRLTKNALYQRVQDQLAQTTSPAPPVANPSQAHQTD